MIILIVKCIAGLNCQAGCATGYICEFVFGYLSDSYNTFLILRCVLAILQRRRSGMLDITHNIKWDPLQLLFVSNEHTLCSKILGSLPTGGNELERQSFMARKEIVVKQIQNSFSPNMQD